MKILMVCTVPLRSNGIAACILNYSRAVNSPDCAIHILAPEGVPQQTCEMLAREGVRLHQLPFRKEDLPGYLTGLYKLLRREKYDIIHVHGSSCIMALELAVAALARIPVRIAHSHNTDCLHRRAHMLMKPLFRLCVNARFACGQAAGQWLFGSKPFHIIPNGIHMDKFLYDPERRSQFRRELGIGEDKRVFGHVGLFIYEKNHAFLVALAKAMKAAENWQLLLVGSGPYLEEIRRSVEAAGLTDKVIFTGRVYGASGYMQAMDAFLLPSHYEGLPFVLIEAQASGLPCLVSENVSREADVTKTLQFLPIDSVAPWLSAIAALDTGSRKARSLASAKALTQAGYDLTENAKELRRLYASLLS